MIEYSFLFNLRQNTNFLSIFKLFIEKRELWGKRNIQSLRQTMIQRKLWHKSKIELFNGHWITSLFENVLMDKFKTNDFYV